MTNETRPICMDCSWGATESGIAVLLCPRHAQAGEMETLLRDLGPAYEAAIRALGHGHEFPQIRAIVERATEILSSIDQEKT